MNEQYKCPKCGSENIRFFFPVSFEFIDGDRDLVAPADQDNTWDISGFKWDTETSCQDCDFEGELDEFTSEREIGGI